MSLAAATVLFSCQNSQNGKDKVAEDDQTHGIQTKYMDTTVRPQDDFYSYVNGGCMKTAEIPDDRTSWGGFQILRKNTDTDVLKILKEAESSGEYEASSDQGKAIQVFNSIMDTVSRNEAGVEPIMSTLAKIEAIENVEDIQQLLAEHPSTVSAPFFGLSAYSDPDDSNVNVAYIGNGGLGLPDRDYYLKYDENSKEIRAKYQDHIAKMLLYFGVSEDEAKAKAETILKLETKLAEPRLDKVARRDFRNFNNRYAVEDLNTVASSIDWKDFMTRLGIEKQPDTILVMEPKYMNVLDQVLQNTNIEDLKTLMQWSTINDAASQLTTELATKNWEF